MEDVDPHIWLDPNIAIQMAENIAAALSQAKPSKAEYFQQNLDGFVLEVTNVCSKYESLFAELDDKNVVSCSGTFSYLFPAFDFNEVFVIQPIHGQEASPRAIVQAMEIIKDQNIKAIVGDAELPYAANVIAQDTNIMPLLLRSGEGNLDNLDNYIGLLEYNLRQIANIYVD